MLTGSLFRSHLDPYPFSGGGWKALLLAWGFGRYAPEASVGMSRDPEKALTDL